MEQVQMVNSSEYSAAFFSLRAGKNVFLWLVVLAILAQMAAFVMVDFVGVLDVAEKATPADALPVKVTNQADEYVVTCLETEDARSKIWRPIFLWALPGSKFLGFAATMLLWVILAYAVQMSLVGRIGGAGSLTTAMLWGLVLLALLAPWQNIIQGSLVTGSLFNLEELETATRQIRSQSCVSEIPIFAWITYYSRFLGLPGVSLLVGIVIQLKFANAVKVMVLPLRESLESV